MKETEDYQPRKRDDVDSDDPRLMQALRAYQAALEEGRRPSRKQFLAQHPDIATELSECLDGLEFLHSAAPRLLPGDPGTTQAEPLTPDGPLGDFRLIREVGRGGMGVVYEAVQISLGRRVALKVLPLAATLDARQLQRFENEARAAAHLHHAHIVPVFAVGCERGVHYYAMQFIDGQSLAAIIDKIRPSPRAAEATASTVACAGSLTHQSVGSKEFFRAAAGLGVQAADALEYAHQMGVVHRDIKPANLLLDGRGNLWVADFGLARFQTSPALTTPGDIVGTLRYMSPEQAGGQPVIDPRSDVYSLGATLYELLTQQPAFPSHDRRECLRLILHEEPIPPRRINRAMPAELETIILKAMAKEPEQRYASARELAEDLRLFLDDRPVQARRPGLQERAARWARRHRRVVAAGVVGLIAAVLILGVTTWRIARAEARALAAYQDLKEEEERTAAALENEVTQRDRAERNYRQARKVLDYLTRLGVEDLADKPQVQEVRRRLLTELLTYYKEFIEQDGGDPAAGAELIETRVQLAELLDEVGKKAESLVVYEKAMQDEERLPGGPRPSVPFAPPRGLARLYTLAQPGVHQDLKLTPEQMKKLTPVFDLRKKQPTRESVTAAEKAVAATLTDQQAERLTQLIRQSRGLHALLDGETVEALGLTSAQKGTIHNLLNRSQRLPRRGGHGHGRGGPGRWPDVDWKQVQTQVLRVLEPQQRDQWQALLGEPFRGQFRPAPPPRPPAPRGR